MTKYPCIDEIGLTPYPSYTISGSHMKEPQVGGYQVCADDLEALLARGVRMNGSLEPEYKTWLMESNGRATTPTHSALLIDIKPIQRDTAEGLLREIVEKCTGWNFDKLLFKDADEKLQFVERARRLLDK